MAKPNQLKNRNQEKLGKTIRLRPDTVQRIDSNKPRGQTYDGFISILIDHYEQTQK